MLMSAIHIENGILININKNVAGNNLVYRNERALVLDNRARFTWS